MARKTIVQEAEQLLTRFFAETKSAFAEIVEPLKKIRKFLQEKS